MNPVFSFLMYFNTGITFLIWLFINLQINIVYQEIYKNNIKHTLKNIVPGWCVSFG